jgi:ribonuclease BN (tRNA processing enzyme)
MVKSSKQRRLPKNNYLYFPKTLISNQNKQLRFGTPWLFNGFILKIGEDVMAVDPGVNFLLRLSEDDFDLSTINKIYISHLHLDHSADANALMDWLIRARAFVDVIAPGSVFQTNTISDFHSGKMVHFKHHHNYHEINKNSEIKIADTVMKFFPLNHSVECLGFFINNHQKISYISDTGYATEVQDINGNVSKIDQIEKPTNTKILKTHNHIKKAVKDSDVLIVNIDGFLHNKNSSTHLSVIDLIDILMGSGIKLVVIAHINPVAELQYSDWGEKLTDYIKNETGIKTLCPDVTGLKVDLD